jgi:hypothetical protein
VALVSANIQRGREKLASRRAALSRIQPFLVS